MKPSKRMRANGLAQNILQHITNSAIVVRNMLEDGAPDQKISPEDIRGALGDKSMLVIDKILSLAIDPEDEEQRVQQRKAERDAKAGRTPTPPVSPPNAPPATSPTGTPPKRRSRRT